MIRKLIVVMEVFFPFSAIKTQIINVSLSFFDQHLQSEIQNENFVPILWRKF